MRIEKGEMLMLQIAVCDDNIDELSNMTKLINQYRSWKHLNCEYAVFQNGFELVSALEKGKRFDIYCLDIIMPGFTGIDIAKFIAHCWRKSRTSGFCSFIEDP